MPVRRPRRRATFRAKCGEKVSVQEGHKIRKCPNGHSEFKSRTKEPGNKS